ncbi:fibronectin type III domain protein [Ancylostoma duodenale]|uniref:Fibronectin type III domain protein n=1 Tax=Ancylostoma duodenale TaxID=51022 RepID=A0A0C2C809_9BILA|nr:fibronectin type III domain protein [Ancylostoma duodenale]
MSRGLCQMKKNHYFLSRHWKRCAASSYGSGFASKTYTDFSSLFTVRPVAPSSPDVKAFSNRSVTLAWNHNTARAHRPILRFSVVVRSVDDDSRFVIPAPSNATTVIVDNLSPDTLYAFAVRAENAAGHSPFGPETRFRTLGEATNYI